MPYKNPKELLTDATKLPAAIEERLPEGAPKISTMLVDATAKLPDLPDFPTEIPDLPEVPELPEMPGLPAPPGAELRRRLVTGVEVRPAGLAPKPRVTPIVQEIIPSPAVGVIPQIETRRGM